MSQPASPAETLADATERLRRLSMRLWQRVEDELGLSPMQAQVLEAIDRGATQVSAVAGACDRHVSSASRIVDALVERRLVTRVEDPTDRRAVVLDLTAEGERAVERIVGEHQGFLAEVLAHMDPVEVRALTETLTRFADVAERTAEDLLAPLEP